MEANEAAPATIAKGRWLPEDLAAPLSKRPIKDISSAEIPDLLKTIEKSGRAAILEEGKFGALLRAIDEYDGWPTRSAALKFLALTCVRPGGVRHAVRSEFDLDRAIWRIPAERMKTPQPHDVPLSKQALQVLDEIWSFSEGGVLVFPSVRANKKPLSENAMNAALRRMGYTKEEVTAHGFRATASSFLNARGFDPDVIEAVLTHQDRNSIRRAYNRSTYRDQRVTLMQEWAADSDDLAQRMRGRGRIGRTSRPKTVFGGTKQTAIALRKTASSLEFYR